MSKAIVVGSRREPQMVLHVCVSILFRRPQQLPFQVQPTSGAAHRPLGRIPLWKATHHHGGEWTCSRKRRDLPAQGNPVDKQLHVSSPPPWVTRLVAKFDWWRRSR
uniref:Uncharacterized protein n=1 Tax=Mesocestoides corti TaxID=53468 RepID=A0A5K3F834_MESCO